MGNAEGASASRGSLRFFLFFLAMIPLFLSRLYGSIPVRVYISDSSIKDFAFKMLGLAAVGLFVPVRELRWFWWAALFSHFITKDALFRGDASFYLTNVAVALIVFSAAWRWMDASLFRWFCLAVLVSVVANLALQVVQLFQFDPIHTFRRVHHAGLRSGGIVRAEQVPCGFMGNLVSLGIYYSICLPTLLVSTGRWFPVAGGVLLLGILLTHSKIALILGGLVYLACCWPILKARGSRLGTVALLLFTSFVALVPWSLSHASTLHHAVSHRWIIWKGSMLHLTDPWLGDGLSSWFLRRFWYGGSIWPQACNEYVQVFYELGAVGLAFTGWYLWRLGWRVPRTLDVSGKAALLSVAATLVSALVFFPFHMPQMSAVFIVCLAYLERIACVGIA